MAARLIIKLLALASVAAVPAYAFNNSDTALAVATHYPEGLRRLGIDGVSPGNVAACYGPFHNTQYPLNGGAADVNALRAAIEDDFRIMSQHFTHVRTYYSQYYGIEVAPIAKKYGLKLFLGVFLTKESWGATETNAAVNAIKYHSDTVEVVSVGNENLQNFYQRSGDILAKITEIKNKAGADAGRVKYATVQRVTEFLESKYDWDMQQLSNNLDILGVNIYPFFDNGYDGNYPTKLLDTLWNLVVTKWPRDKIMLTETGFPTAGKPSVISPKVVPSLDASIKYYEGVVNWTPAGYEGKPKYWFQAFDRRPEDPSATPDLERYFGFYKTTKQPKAPGFPRLKNFPPSTPAPTTTAPTPTTTPIVTPTLTPTPAPTDVKPTPAPACVIEEGVDYVANDIANSLAATAEGCFAACTRLAGCGAFSWTNYNGGTCWLKSGKGATTPNAQVRSGLLCACDTTRQLVTGVDYTGKDIANARAATASACFALCDKQAGCLAFSWSNYNGGTCWLKAARGDAVPKDGVVSGGIC